MEEIRKFLSEHEEHQDEFWESDALILSLIHISPEQKDVLAEMLQDEHIAGIHDTLAYINEMMAVSYTHLDVYKRQVKDT